MASSRNMKVWSRCTDCGEWSEDCDCVCGFVREQEETLIHFSDSYSREEDDREIRSLEIRYNVGGYGCDDCDDYDDDDDGYDDYDYGYNCDACLRSDCGGDGWSNDCGWLTWAEELLSRRSNPLHQMAEGLGVLWQA